MFLEMTPFTLAYRYPAFQKQHWLVSVRWYTIDLYTEWFKSLHTWENDLFNKKNLLYTGTIISGRENDLYSLFFRQRYACTLLKIIQLIAMYGCFDPRFTCKNWRCSTKSIFYKNEKKGVSFEVLTAVLLKIQLLWTWTSVNGRACP